MVVPSRPVPAPRLVDGGIFDGLEQREVDAFAAAMVALLISAARRRGLIPEDEPAERPPPVRLRARRS